MKRSFQISRQHISAAASLVLFLWLAFSLIQPAAPVSADLPPRPEPTPAPTPTKTATSQGAQIKLVLEQPIGGEWTVVEWQNHQTGEWIKVEGWQGMLEANGRQVWWVGREHFGKGPFRWLVYAGENGLLLETSESFMMPTRDRQVVVVLIPAVNN